MANPWQDLVASQKEAGQLWGGPVNLIMLKRDLAVVEWRFQLWLRLTTCLGTTSPSTGDPWYMYFPPNVQAYENLGTITTTIHIEAEYSVGAEWDTGDNRFQWVRSAGSGGTQTDTAVDADAAAVGAGFLYSGTSTVWQSDPDMVFNGIPRGVQTITPTTTGGSGITGDIARVQARRLPSDYRPGDCYVKVDIA